MPGADAHLHLFADGFAGVLGASPAGGDELVAYERLRQHHGIERGIVIGYEGEPRYAGNNDYVLALAETRPWMAPIAYLPVSPPPTVRRLVELRERGAAGFALYLPHAEHGPAMCAWPATTLAELRAQRAILSLNARPSAVASISEAVDSLADDCPILVSHLGLPGRFVEPPSLFSARKHLAPLLALAGREHVAVKLSGLYAISDPAHAFPHASAQPFVDVVLEAFGPSRLLWGSDFSPALDFVSFPQAADACVLAACSAGEVDDVMGGNLLRLLDARRRE